MAGIAPGSLFLDMFPISQPQGIMSKKKRVRHVLIVFHASYPEIKGGINKMIATLAQAWIQDGIRVSILVPGGWEDREWSHRVHGAIQVHRQRLRLPWDRKKPLRGLLGWMMEFPRVFWRLRQFVRDQEVDLIHLHTPREDQYFFRLLHEFGGPPYVITFHGTDALHFSLGQINHPGWMGWIVRGALGLTAVARHYAALIERHHPGLAPVHFVANGIDVAAGGPKEGSLPWLPEHFLIQVGWVEPPKAPDVTIRAWGLLQYRHPDLHLLLVGDQPYRQTGEPWYPGYVASLHALIATLGCQDRVHWVGTVDQPTLHAIMQRSRGLVFPSRMEGMPYVLLEAGLVGLPVVCSDIPAFGEWIVDDVQGLLFPVDDHERLAAAVDRLMREEGLAQRIGQNLNRLVVEQHDAMTMARHYIDLFNALLEK